MLLMVKVGISIVIILGGVKIIVIVVFKGSIGGLTGILYKIIILVFKIVG